MKNNSRLTSLVRWQRIVVRLPKRSGVILAYIFLIFGVIIWGNMFIVRNTPVLRFEELDKRSGVLQGAGYSGRNQDRWVSLRQPNGQVLVYNANPQQGKIELLQSLLGKSVTVYSQKQFRITLLGNDEMLMEVECEGKKWLDYNYERRLWKNQHWWSFGSSWVLAAIPTLMIILSLLALWKIGRNSDVHNPNYKSNPEKE